jgi:hypothetical protein
MLNCYCREHLIFYDYDSRSMRYIHLRSLSRRISWVVGILFIIHKCCLRASVDTEMCCSKGKCGCQYFIVSFAKVTRYRSFCLILFGKDICRHVLLSNAIHLYQIKYFCSNTCRWQLKYCLWIGIIGKFALLWHCTNKKKNKSFEFRSQFGLVSFVPFKLEW